MPLSSATLKTRLSTPLWVSFKLSSRLKQQRPHIRNCRAHRMALFAVQIPKDRRIRGEVKFFQAEFVESLANFRILLTGPGDSRTNRSLRLP